MYFILIVSPSEISYGEQHLKKKGIDDKPGG